MRSCSRRCKTRSVETPEIPAATSPSPRSSTMAMQGTGHTFAHTPQPLQKS